MNPAALPIAKKIGQVIFGFALLFATALAFQNCSGYQVYDSVTDTDLSSACGAACDQSIDGLSLKLTNSRISLQDLDLYPYRAVDIAGYCDDAEFSDSVVQYQFIDGATAVTEWRTTNVKCDDLGRFQIEAEVPLVSASRSYLLLVRLAIPLGNGQYLLSPAAQKSVNIDIYK